MLLTLDRLQPLRESSPTPGYWCEALARTAQDGQSFWLGSYNPPTPRLALRWLRHRTLDILDQLDPPAAWPAHHWLRDDTEHERALSTLAHGETYAFSIVEDTTSYILSARPAGDAPVSW
jgi:hypothetical protein